MPDNDPTPAVDPAVADPEVTPAADPAADPAAAPEDGTVLTNGADGPQGAPEEYADFDLPNDIEINTALLDAARPIFKEVGLSQVGAQALVNMFADQIKADSATRNDAYAQQNKTWQDEARADSVVGGDDFEQKVGKAKTALDKFGSPGLMKLLQDTGLGNHPDVIRAWYKVGLTIAEDVPGGDADPSDTPKSAAEILYPNAKRA